MLSKINDYLNKYNLIQKGESIVVALSGGVDSMVLFHSLKSMGFNVIVAHVNHKKRIESDMEEENIIKLCESTNTPYEILHLDKINTNFEATAHNKRYEFFINVAKKYKALYIATAHHQDDNAETILMNIMSGSNMYGYGGISKDLIIDNVHIIRPLLFLSKDEIKVWAKDNNITYYEDYTNSLDDFTRNRIRHHIIPVLKKECPNFLDRTNAYSNQIHEAFEFIRGISIKYLLDNRDQINTKSFSDLHPFLKKDIICLLLEKYNVLRSENLINDLLSVISNNKPQLEYSLKGNLTFIKRYERCFIKKVEKTNAYLFKINNKNDIIDNNQFKIYLTDKAPSNAIYLKLCYNDIVFPLTIRNRLNGDKISLNAGYKKIKDLFIDHKVLKEDRDTIPLVLDGNNNIIWVYNIAKSKDIFKYKDNYDIFLVLEVK